MIDPGDGFKIGEFISGRRNDQPCQAVVLDKNDDNGDQIDFESMNPLFECVFGDKRVMRECLGHLIMYSMTYLVRLV
jgi:hypothetical protein